MIIDHIMVEKRTMPNEAAIALIIGMEGAMLPDPAVVLLPAAVVASVVSVVEPVSVAADGVLDPAPVVVLGVVGAVEGAMEAVAASSAEPR